MQNNTTIYHRQLGAGGFLGVDFTSAPYRTDPRRLSRALNLWHDWGAEMGGFLETFPGFRCLSLFDAPIYGLFPFHPVGAETPFLIVHTGDKLFAVSVEAGKFSATPVLIQGGMAEQESAAFVLGGQMGILDGSRYRLLTYDKSQNTFTLTPAENLYTPITYADDLPYEQRNALSSYFSELWHLPYTEGYGEGEVNHLSFEVISHAEKTCRLTGTKKMTSLVRVPSLAHIDGQVYRVTEIGERAFQNNNVIEVLVVEEGVEVIGRYALNTCLSLSRVSLPSSLVHIKKAAFAYCDRLEEVHLGEGVTVIADHAFYRCTTLSAVSYGGSKEDWATVEIGTNNEPLTDLTPDYETATGIYARCYRVTVHEKCVGIRQVAVGGNEIGEKEYFLTADTVFQAGKAYYTALGVRYVKADTSAGETVAENTYYEKRSIWYEPVYETVEGENLLTALYILAEDGRSLPESQCILEGELSALQFAPVEEAELGSIAPLGKKDAIHSATLCTVFDGRVFLAGSPASPSTVFYAQRTRHGQVHPAYFGICNYMEDGTDNVGFCAMCATPASLYLFKGENATEGVVYCHTPKDTSSHLLPRIYPATSGAIGNGAVGAACHFADDTVYLSKTGLLSVDRSTLSLERGVCHRSFFVDAKLTEEDLCRTKAVEWQGYLLLLCPSGHVYMADSRLRSARQTGETGYEWVYLEGVGGYVDDLPVYRFATAFPSFALSCRAGDKEILLSPEGDGLPFDTYEAYEENYSTAIISAELTFTKDTGETFSEMGHYVEMDTNEGKRYYLLAPIDERTGGRLSPPTAGVAVGEQLFIGTADGHLLVANTDLRGVAYQDYPPPDSHTVDRHFYHICHHRIESLAMTVADNADRPTVTKTTMKKGTVLDTKAMPGSRITVSVATDKTNFQPIGVFTEGQISFEDADLYSFVFGDRPRGQAVFSENTKRWSYKQYAMHSNDYQRPFGIGQLSYRYRVQGRIKPL